MVKPGDQEGEIPVADEPVESIAARARRDSAARDRRRRESLERRAAESRSITDTLCGALERTAIVHATCWQDPLSGTVVAVGVDVVEILAGTTTWFVSLDSITAVGVSAGTRISAWDERASTCLTDVLADLVDMELPTVVALTSGRKIAGIPVAFGETLAISDDAGSLLVVEPTAIGAAGVRRG